MEINAAGKIQKNTIAKINCPNTALDFKSIPAPACKLSLQNKQKVENLTNQLAKLPEIRNQKVQDLKARIKSGDYQVCLQEIAAKILKEIK